MAVVSASFVWMIGIFAIGLFFVLVAAQFHMRSGGGEVTFFQVVGIVAGFIAGAWLGKALVDAWYGSLTPPPEIWMGALWIGASIIGGLVAGAIILGLSAFPQKEG